MGQFMWAQAMSVAGIMTFPVAILIIVIITALANFIHADFMILVLIVGTATRYMLRQKYGQITGFCACFFDCLATCFCGDCATAQESEFVHHKERRSSE